MTFDKDHDRHIVLAREVIRNEAKALEQAAAGIGTEFVEAVELIATSRRHVLTTGVGKSGHVARKIAAMFASTGTPATFLHPGEAIHGDMGGIRRGDVALLLSHSGETPELISMLPMLKRFDMEIIAITDNPKSTISLVANVALFPGSVSRADPIGLAPTASTAAAMALGDALALAVAQHHGYSTADFEHHPGGALGKLLQSVYSQPIDDAA